MTNNGVTPEPCRESWKRQVGFSYLQKSYEQPTEENSENFRIEDGTTIAYRVANGLKSSVDSIPSP